MLAKGHFSLSRSDYFDRAEFGNSQFEGEFYCSSKFKAQAGFSNCVFWDRATFFGWSNISISVGGRSPPPVKPSLLERFRNWIAPIESIEFLRPTAEPGVDQATLIPVSEIHTMVCLRNVTGPAVGLPREET
jgi:hypothetical protein